MAQKMHVTPPTTFMYHLMPSGSIFYHTKSDCGPDSCLSQATSVWCLSGADDTGWCHGEIHQSPGIMYVIHRVLTLYTTYHYWSTFISSQCTNLITWKISTRCSYLGVQSNQHLFGTARFITVELAELRFFIK